VNTIDHKPTGFALRSFEHLNRVILIAASATVFILIWIYALPHFGQTRFEVPEVPPSNVSEPYFEEIFVSEGLSQKAHAATILLSDDGPIAFWYAGSKEGASDVQIFQASFDGSTWDEAIPVINPVMVQDRLYRLIRKVGNPAGFRLKDGKIWLFFVTVSVGGWAGSSLNLIESTDNGETWGDPKRLITSPFLNISTLVRNQPFYYTDGTIGLPVYHEFLGKFGEILRLDSTGEILEKQRLSKGRDALQPAIVATTEMDAIGLLRYAGKPPNRLLQVTSEDGGNNWTPPTRLNLPNPNAATTAISIGNGKILAVLNNAAQGRNDMSLAVSTAGKNWQVFHTLESVDASPISHEYEFSYPALLRDNSGIYHLLYSWNHKFIKHTRFNEAWLTKMLARHENTL
jgi:predicted neuraminidase